MSRKISKKNEKILQEAILPQELCIEAEIKDCYSHMF